TSGPATALAKQYSGANDTSTRGCPPGTSFHGSSAWPQPGTATAAMSSPTITALPTREVRVATGHLRRKYFVIPIEIVAAGRGGDNAPPAALGVNPGTDPSAAGTAARRARRTAGQPPARNPGSRGSDRPSGR